MAIRILTSAPLIDDHSGLNIEGTITFLSNQVAGQKIYLQETNRLGSIQ